MSANENQNKVPLEPEDDPAYNNPVGKLPPNQPFGPAPTVFHSDLEREELAGEWFGEILPELRTRQMKRPLQVLEELRKRWRSAKSRIEHSCIEKDRAQYEEEKDMLYEAIDLWAVEMALATKDLRKELAQYIIDKYPSCGKELARDLRGDKL